MRFLFDLFSKDPSKNWTRAAGSDARLAFQLATASLNGVAVEDAFEKIGVFGRPANREPFARQRFEYPELGLEIGGEGGRVKYFSFSLQTFSGKTSPCKLTLISERGTPLGLTGNTKIAEIQNILGSDYESEEFDGEMTYRFKHKRLTLTFEFDEAGCLMTFEAGREDFV